MPQGLTDGSDDAQCPFLVFLSLQYSKEETETPHMHAYILAMAIWRLARVGQREAGKRQRDTRREGSRRQ